MIPEIGHFALIMALSAAFLQALFPISGYFTGNGRWLQLARPAVFLQFTFVALAFICLTYSFIISDFSVVYVTQHSNTALPLLYRISAVWGAHEGSLLLWALILSIWTLAVTLFSRRQNQQIVALVLSFLGMVSIGFLLFMLLTSNPFARQFPPAPQGFDLNPLLQDPGLAIHPPMLYMGYVGLAVPFSYAMAAMLSGKMDSAWARWSRPWTLVAWLFLTLGISLGSWWAYYELGWGGWWFWDPVENASFMPWLVGTALIHSLAATENRNVFKSWTLLLAIFGFSLSLLGTFLVRSGVLTSVHSFASDPKRGVFILIFLSIVIGGSLLLYSLRAPRVKSTGVFQLFSRETALLLNNVILVVVAASVLLGTLYPLVLDALGVGKISVGPPYFNAVFVPLMLPLALLISIGSIMRWRQDSPLRVMRLLAYSFIASIILGALFAVLFLNDYNPIALASTSIAIWIIISSVENIIYRLRKRGAAVKTGIPRAVIGMHIAHFGVGIFIIGVTVTSLYSSEKDLRMSPGDSYSMAEYQYQFKGVKKVNGVNYIADIGEFIVTNKQGQQIAVLTPQKRTYRVQRNPMTEAAIDAGLTRDLFVALGEPLDAQGAWSVRLYHKPFIRFIWLGTIFMALGGLLAASDRRYRVRVKKPQELDIKSANMATSNNT